MASRYSVIQYVPNPIADERINIGVLAFNERTVKVKFVSRWERVRCFGAASDLPVIKDFATRMKAAAEAGLLFPGDEPGDIPGHERLAKIAKGWINSIQFTAPRGSLEPLDALLEDIAATYLMERPQQQFRPRDRQGAARVTTSKIRHALERLYDTETAKSLLKAKYSVKGNRESHTFDVTVANGKPILSAHGISFEVPTPEEFRKSLAWMISDVKAAHPSLPLAIVALPPLPETSDHDHLQSLYKSTVEIYQGMGAEVLPEEKVEDWASHLLSR
jgi:Protein of unknown function (DUF3037)